MATITNEEIRQRAIACGNTFNAMCDSKQCEVDEEFNKTCHCEYNDITCTSDCATVYGYEHGFNDGVEEGKRLALEIINSLDFSFGFIYDPSAKIKYTIANALQEKGERKS